MSHAVVGVVMPLYNGAAHVAEAVTSLLAQTGIDLELIVVDDGSTDEGPEIIRRIAPRTTILRRPQPGVATARNMGVEAAEGEYLAFLDADDVLPDRSLAVRLSRLEGDPSLGAVFGRMEEFVTIGQGGSTAPVRSPVGPTDARLAPTMLIRRRAFHEVGGFDPAVGRWYFLDWLVRLSASDVTWSQIPDVVLRRRLHDTNSGLRIGGQHQELLSTLRSGLSRARAPDPSDDVARDSSEHL